MIARPDKMAMINFFVPNAGYYTIKHIWDKLGRFYYKSDLLIGDVDCSSPEGQAVCEKQGISMYPSIYFYEKSATSVKHGIDFPNTGSLISNRTTAYSTLKWFLRVQLNIEPDECNFYTKVGCTDEELSIMKDTPATSLTLQAAMGSYKRNRLKNDKLHRLQLKKMYEGLKEELAKPDAKPSLEEEFNREMKEFVQGYVADRHKVTRIIRLLANLHFKTGVEEMVKMQKFRTGRLKETKKEKEFYESAEWKQYMEMNAPRAFTDFSDGKGYVQTHGPRAEDFDHLPHSKFKSPYVFDPRRHKTGEPHRDAKIDDGLADEEIDFMEDDDAWHVDL